MKVQSKTISRPGPGTGGQKEENWVRTVTTRTHGNVPQELLDRLEEQKKTMSAEPPVKKVDKPPRR